MALPAVVAVFGVFRLFCQNFVIHFVMSNKWSGANVLV